MFGQDDLQKIAFIGDTLAPLFLHEPTDLVLQDLLVGLTSLDTRAAGYEWPFVDSIEASSDLMLITQGLAAGPGDSKLVDEYRRLLIGPAHRPAPPWGSVYTDRDCVVFGDTCIALREWMRANEVAYSNEAKEPEDHIGRMLSLLAWLARNKPDVLEEFLRDHLLIWSHHFLESFYTATTHPFYQGLARLTDVSLEGIRIAYDIGVQYPRFYR